MADLTDITHQELLERLVDSTDQAELEELFQEIYRRLILGDAALETATRRGRERDAAIQEVRRLRGELLDVRNRLWNSEEEEVEDE